MGEGGVERRAVVGESVLGGRLDVSAHLERDLREGDGDVACGRVQRDGDPLIHACIETQATRGRG